MSIKQNAPAGTGANQKPIDNSIANKSIKIKDFENIPTELKSRPQWVVHKYKQPINPYTGYGAKAGESKTWANFEKALEAYKTGKYDGIGFEFDNNGLVGIDLDTVRDPETGEIAAEAEEIIQSINSYTEISPSGYGFHIICNAEIALQWNKANLPNNGIIRPDIDLKTGLQRQDKAGNLLYKSPEIEMYTHNRYFTITGNVWGTVPTIQNRRREIQELHKKYTPSRDFPTDPSSSRVVDQLAGNKNYLQIGLDKDEIFRRLWEGDRPAGNESSDDLSLMNKLAYWCNCDADKMISAFMKSPHYQQKDAEHEKKANRKDYLLRTAQRAIKDCGQTAAEQDAAYEARISSHKRPAENEEKPALNLETIQQTLEEENISIRKNLITNQIEIKGLPKKYSVEDAPNSLPVILLDKLQKKGIKASLDRIEAYISVIADINRYNPVETYLKSSKWDNKDRLQEVFSILHIEELKYRNYVLKWLIQCVAMALNDANNPVGSDGILVLQGEQGIGKTQFFRKISPHPSLFAEGVTIDMNVKDTVINATSAWIVELGELDSTLKREQSALKAFITASWNNIRLPYARNATMRPRRTSFCATVNPADYLRDDTGSRRYWTIPVLEIDLNRLNSLSKEWVKQLWLQVYELYQRKPDGFRLSATEREQLQKDNLCFDKELPYEAEVRDMLDFEMPVYDWQWYSTTEIKVQVGGGIRAEQVGKIIAKIAKENNLIKKKRTGNGYQYLVPLKK